MPHAQSHFQPIAELPSEYGLTLWGYATRRDPASVRAPGYFQAFGHHLRAGDLLLVRHTGDTGAPPAVPHLGLFAVDRDARGTVVLHPLWSVDWAALRAASGDAAAPAVAPADAATPDAATPDAAAPKAGPAGDAVGAAPAGPAEAVPGAAGPAGPGVRKPRR
jgi:hypothetical protein